ncbi:hypothetical protein WA158_000498 [Blastocystis sp. Blastoise]
MNQQASSIIKEQDAKLDELENMITSFSAVSRAVKDELTEQHGLLEDVERNVDEANESSKKLRKELNNQVRSDNRLINAILNTVIVIGIILLIYYIWKRCRS